MASPISPLLGRNVKKILDSHPDPLGILHSTAPVIRHAEFVKLDSHRIDTVARVFASRALTIPRWDYQFHYFDGTERTANYIFLLDALNFSFWGKPKWSLRGVDSRLDGYWGLAKALKIAATRDPDFLNAEHLAEISPLELGKVLRGNLEIPLFVERWRNVQELGRVLINRFGGSAARVIDSAGFDAPRLAKLIADNFSSFRDTTIYREKPVNFFKRAQIVAADLRGAFDGKGFGELSNLDQLTAFADYKLPQILRAWGILNYAPKLARRVDQRIELEKDSPEEIEIRASMIWGVELLKLAMGERGGTVTSIQMDWFLWQSSQGKVKGMRPYHRVRTIFY